MSKFMDRLCKRENQIDLAYELRKQELPLVMLGCGEVAQYVLKYLRNNFISIDAVCIDDEYWGDNLEIVGCKVYSYSVICQRLKKFNIIMGHGEYQQGKQIQKRKSVERVFYLVSPFYRTSHFQLDEILQDAEQYEKAYDLYYDQYSKDCMMAFLNTRISGDMDYALKTFQKHTTFFDNDIIKLSGEEVYWDLGAFTGDTVNSFLAQVQGNFEKIIALEPDPENYNILVETTRRTVGDNIITLRMAAWNEDTTLEFTIGEDKLSGIGNAMDGEKILVKARTIDSLAEEYGWRMSLLKSNYYPCALEAIIGARNLIQRDKPQIAMMIGFDSKSVYEVVNYLNLIVPEYRFYLRFMDAIVTTLTLYAVVAK